MLSNTTLQKILQLIYVLIVIKVNFQKISDKLCNYPIFNELQKKAPI